MEAKEKAKELYESCYYKLPALPPKHMDILAKEFAGLIISEVQSQAKHWGIVSTKAFWQNVKIELNNI